MSACRPSPLRRLPARPLPRARRRRPRRGAGEIVLLSGGNGAGKTTLLRLLAGLVPLHQGEGEVLGTDLSRDRRSHRRRLAPRRPGDLLLRRPHRRREPALRGAGQRRHGRGRATTPLGRARPRAARRRPPRQALHRTAPPARARDRARARSPSCCCSTSRTPGSTPPGRAYLDSVLKDAAANGRVRRARVARARAGAPRGRPRGRARRTGKRAARSPSSRRPPEPAAV